MTRLVLAAWLVACSLISTASAVCTVPARTGCMLGTAPGAARLAMRGGNLSRLAFKWRKGQETLVSDFGDPFAGTSYSLCMYDASGTTLRNGNTEGPEPCNSTGPTPCWRVTSTGFRYKRVDFSGRASKLTLQAGPAGKASVKFNSRTAVVLANPGFQVVLPLVVQLQASDGACWESTFSTAIVNNLTADFRAISD